MTSSTGSRVVSVAVAFAATWASAQADIVTVTLTPSTDIEHFRVFTQQQVTNASTTVLQNQALSEDFGAVVSGSSITKSFEVNFEALAYQDARVGIVGSVGSDLLVGTGGLSSGSDFATNYGSTVPEDDITLAQAYSAVGTGDGTLLPRLFPKDNDDKSILLTRADLAGKTGNLLLFDGRTGASSSAGTWTVSVQAVPEPTTMATLALGAAALIRRRRRA